MAGFFERHDNVYLYVPNLIGYARIASVLYAFAIAFQSPSQFVFFYFVSFVCDELDGRFARLLKQTSTLGAVLDMVTDRLATAGLLMVLAVQSPCVLPLSTLLVFLDIFSHWFQMYSTLALGASTHKDVGSRSWLVRTYYARRIFMGYCCVSCEVLYLVIYAGRWSELMRWRLPGAGLSLPPPVAEALPALAPYFPSVGGLPIFTLFGLAAVPGFFTKQLCNWVQLRTAADNLILYDRLAAGKKQ